MSWPQVTVFCPIVLEICTCLHYYDAHLVYLDQVHLTSSEDLKIPPKMAILTYNICTTISPPRALTREQQLRHGLKINWSGSAPKETSKEYGLWLSQHVCSKLRKRVDFWVWSLCRKWSVFLFSQGASPKPIRYIESKSNYWSINFLLWNQIWKLSVFRKCSEYLQKL